MYFLLVLNIFFGHGLFEFLEVLLYFNSVYCWMVELRIRCGWVYDNLFEEAFNLLWCVALVLFDSLLVLHQLPLQHLYLLNKTAVLTPFWPQTRFTVRWPLQKFLNIFSIKAHVPLDAWETLLDPFDIDPTLLEEKLYVFIVHGDPLARNWRH